MLVSLIILLISIESKTQTSNIRFKRIGTEHGLSVNSVTCIYQDIHGFIWIGTDVGLNRFDGYDFKVFHTNSFDTNSISHSGISDILEDETGKLWVNTWNGINHYNPKSENFKKLKLKGSLMEDLDGSIWIYNQSELEWIKKYDLNSGTVDSLVYDPGENKNLINKSVPAMIKDKTGDIWFCVGSIGLCKYDEGDDSFSFYKDQNFTWITSIAEDKDNNLWLAAGKLLLFNKKDGSYKHFEEFNNFNPERAVTGVFVDHEDDVWVYTRNDGLWLYTRSTGTFKQFVNDLSDTYSLSSNKVTCIFEDNNQNLWIGTADGGINLVNRGKKAFHQYQYDPQNPEGLNAKEVQGFYEGQDGRIWITTVGGGLNLFDRFSNTFKHFKHNPDNPKSISSDILTRVIEDGEGKVWSLGYGLHIFDPAKEAFYDIQTPLLSWNLYEDSKGIIWVSSPNGLAKIDLKNDSTKIYTPDRNNPNSISNYYVSSVYEDRNNNFWICTDNGVNKFDRDKEVFQKIIDIHIFYVWEDNSGRLLMNDGNSIFQYFTNTDSLATFINFNESGSLSCLNDENGNLWFATKRGIVKYDVLDNSFKRYDESDGLYIEDFNTISAFYKTRDSHLLFGSGNGFVMFHPDSIEDNNSTYPIVYTDFKLFNRSVPLKGSYRDTLNLSSPLKESILYTKEITLSYDQNIFSFEFASLNFINPDRCEYKYKLEGFNDEWSFTDSKHRQVTYTNLDPGNYQLVISGSNEDGVWNENTASIKLKILPPPWRTWWAYILYGIGIIGLVFGSVRFLIIRERLKNKLNNERLELQKMQELDIMKTQFFGNISHELRTPLTLILGPIKQMYNNTFKGDPKTILGMVVRNSNRLLNLINQLLDYSKLEASTIPLHVSECDMVSFLRLMFGHFESSAQSRNIKYLFQSDTSKLQVYFDKKQFENVMINLLSNAFKFTDDEGQIILRINKSVEDQTIDKGSGVLEIEVEDNGIGIETSKLPYIFDRFYQVEDSNNRRREGSGIGLALVNELVKLQHGSVSVSSMKHRGSTFTIHLPLGNAHYSEAEIVEQEYYPSDVSDLVDVYAADNEIIKARKDLATLDDDNRILLVVDDNSDMRAYIREELSEEFVILEAADGKKGLKKALNNIPDLVISDVMMPEMDGNELCRKLKTDERTSHIPVVLLTAKAGDGARLEGLETGADDYITKPFSPIELKVRIKNLIDQRRKLVEQFKSEIQFTHKQLSYATTDQKFLRRILDTLSKRFQDPEYSSESFAKEVGLSRSQLHRKLKALSGQSTNEFIRIYRLNFSRKLIQKQFGNIAEIAFESGFNNPSYFAECFKKQFGESPSDFIKKYKIS